MMNSTNYTSPESHDYQKEELNVYYTICEVLVAVFAIVGNALVIYVFRKERRLRRRTNYYIVSLAAADFLVGLLGIPFAILSSIGLPTNLHACLFTVSLLVILCTISIFCLVAVSVDRYWAILHPMGYSRNVRTKTAIVIISICWVAGSIVGFLPVLGWHKDTPSDVKCFFLDVMDYNYLVFLYFGTIITPALLLAAFYAHIYQVVLKQLRQTVTMNPGSGRSTGGSSGGTMLRMLGAAQKREVKATQNLAIIVSFFMICWIPLYTINCVLAFCNTCTINSNFMFFCIILSHLNSAVNPLLYAYHLRDFRAALKIFFCNLLGHKEHQLELASNKLQQIGKRSSLNSSQIYYKKKSIEAPKIAAVVKNSAALAAATAGQVNREIWNIPEDSSDSSDSHRHNDRISMVRPATPYRSKTDNISLINQAYVESSSVEEENDDVFLGASPISELENLTKNLKCNVVSTKCKMSSSSPQLSRNLFIIDSDFNSLNLDLNAVSKSGYKDKLKRSLSAEGRTSCDHKKTNGNVVKGSCGS